MFSERQDERKHPAGDGEAGYMLLAVVVMVALVLVALSVAAPIVAKDLRRQKELASQDYALQYVRGIRMYYRKTKAYPPSMDALKKGLNVRYLRREYADPLTGKADWRIIHQPKTKTHYPFGEELSGLSAGLGSAAGLQSSVGQNVGGGATTTVGQTPVLGAGFGGATVGAPTTGANGASGTAGSTTGSSDKGMFGDSAGGIIYGVGPAKDGDSILNPNLQTTYGTWEFWYDPLLEQLYAKGNPLGGGGIGSQSASSFGQNAVTGQSNSSTNPNSPAVPPPSNNITINGPDVSPNP